MIRQEGPPQHESALSSVRVDRLQVTHEDDRRRMTEVFSSPEITIRDTKVLQIKQPPAGEEIVVGGHWEKGVEIQYVLSGEIARLDLADVQTGEEVTHEHITAGSRVFLPAGVAHRLTFREATSVLVCNEVPFSPEKLVVYPPWAQKS